MDEAPASLDRPAGDNRQDGLIEVRVAAIRYAARDTHVYELERADRGPLPSAAPGAHIDLHLPNGLMRQYSLINPGENPTSYLIGVKRDPESRGGSRYMHEELPVGRLLKISAPRNHFPLDETAAETVLIAGGIGITPIWAMVQRLEALGRSWKLHYAARSRSDMAFLEALEAMEPAALQFDDESEGRFLDVAAIVAAAPAEAHLYCCGPLPMLQAFQAATADRPEDHVHLEFFSTDLEPALEGGFTVELAQSGQEFLIPEGKSILEVLRDGGIDVPYSCEEGICGSCETRVISGIPEHRDVVLTPSEQASNKLVMICCAGCKSDRLVLDL